MSAGVKFRVHGHVLKGMLNFFLNMSLYNTLMSYVGRWIIHHLHTCHENILFILTLHKKWGTKSLVHVQCKDTKHSKVQIIR